MLAYPSSVDGAPQKTKYTRALLDAKLRPNAIWTGRTCLSVARTGYLMAPEPLHIFDPRRNFQLQGFAGRAATTTIHDATETGVSISGIFQAAEDFAVLGWWNAYDYFNHLRLKHLPKTDFSGLKLEFDIEYDQTLRGAIRLDAAKYPSVSWEAMTFVTGAGDTHDVRLLDHVTAASGSETARQRLLSGYKKA